MSKNSKSRRRKINMYQWGQKNKKVFASIVCIILVIGMLAGLLQM